MLDMVWLVQVSLGYVRLDQVSLGQVRLDWFVLCWVGFVRIELVQVNYVRVRLDQMKIICFIFVAAGAVAAYGYSQYTQDNLQSLPFGNARGQIRQRELYMAIDFHVNGHCSITDHRVMQPVTKWLFPLPSPQSCSYSYGNPFKGTAGLFVRTFL